MSVLRSSVRCSIFVLTAVCISQEALRGQAAYQADRFVDSIGINVHLHYDGTPYRDDFESVKSRLLELGVRHVRDGLIDTTWQPYYERHNSLGAAGIKGVFIANPTTSTEVLRSYPSRVANSFEAYEAPNEYNDSGDPNWVGTLRNSMVQLRSLHNDPQLTRFPIYGPSLTAESAYSALGDVRALMDLGNLHNYFEGRHPGTPGWGDNGYGSIDWNLRLAVQYSDGKPTVTTETGYWNDTSQPGWVPQEVAGKYMPRVLLEQFRKGIVRTYIYELTDFDQAPHGGLRSSYGLLNRDGSPKPAFTAVKNLLNVLGDPGPNFAPGTLDYSIVGGGPDIRHMVFQKRDGAFFLAVWLEQSGFDVNTRRVVPVSTQSTTLVLGGGLRLLTTYRWQDNGHITTTPGLTVEGSIPLDISDTLTIIEIRPIVVIGPPQAPRNLRIVP